jgi:hypothetical protein
MEMVASKRICPEAGRPLSLSLQAPTPNVHQHSVKKGSTEF